mmetsp:Transcript_1340/g.3067  ORF Transcript_1340/g.3067 Transcript_1340/m.3067 type:complete len:208 (-) Transcript_1340:600-1223(-)
MCCSFTISRRERGSTISRQVLVCNLSLRCSSSTIHRRVRRRGACIGLLEGKPGGLLRLQLGKLLLQGEGEGAALSDSIVQQGWQASKPTTLLPLHLGRCIRCCNLALCCLNLFLPLLLLPLRLLYPSHRSRSLLQVSSMHGRIHQLLPACCHLLLYQSHKGLAQRMGSAPHRCVGLYRCCIQCSCHHKVQLHKFGAAGRQAAGQLRP